MKHTRKAVITAGVSMAIASLGACGSGAKTASSATQASAQTAAAAGTTASAGGGSLNVGAGVADPRAASPATGQATGETDGQGVPAVPETSRALIVTATLKLRAADVSVVVNAVAAIALQQGGNVYNSQVNLDKPASASVEVRVPPFKLADTETAIGKLGTVTGLTQQVQDVTEASADLDARLRTAQASVDRVRGFLDKATSLSDLASLEAQVTQRETTLEQLQAQQRTIADQTALSTLTVAISGPEAVVVSRAHARPSIIAGLRGGWHALIAFVSIVGLVLAAVLPFAVLMMLLGAPAWLLWKRWRGAIAVADRLAQTSPGAPRSRGGNLPPPI